MKLPAKPLAELVDREARWNEISSTRMAENLSITPRRLLAWRSGECKHAELHSADKILVDLGYLWHDVFDDETCARIADMADAG